MYKKMFKVLAPIEKAGGGTWWMKCGIGFLNKDDSINLHIESLPTAGQKDGLKLQIREFSAEELREREEKKAAYSMKTGAATAVAGLAQDSVPF